MEFIFYIEYELPTYSQSSADEVLKRLEDWLTPLNKVLDVQSSTEVFPCSDPETGVKVLNVRMRLQRKVKHLYNYVHLMNIYRNMVALLIHLSNYDFSMSIEESF